MLALCLSFLPVPADLVAGHLTGTGPMSNSSFGSVVVIIEHAVPGMGTSMDTARSAGEVGFGALSPTALDANGQPVSGYSDSDSCLVDVTLDVESLAAVLVHEWTHQLAFSGALGPEVESLPFACQELIAYLQEMLYANARANWLHAEFGFAVLPCTHYQDARDGYDEYATQCSAPLPSWVPPVPPAANTCK